ncbi:MAG: IS1380 family transposase [Bdellovibrionaceae bacterium]|nr:IS1380 family transposase [Pseudobdellovibrionaceae bacterium]MCB9024750.1 IS1380 family transposase [Pseudobdellovibrionaceae bacterium]MCB9026096.1 IS1380 family transposase [Pseudobdellovibrionaceae bacterium]
MPMHHDKHSKKSLFIPAPRYEVSNKAIVSRGGLQALLHIFDSTSLGKELAKCLPEDGSNRSFGNYGLSLLLIASLLSGHDSIEDIEEFDDDELLEELFDGKVPTPKTLGNYLRRFEKEHINALKKFLTTMGYTLRAHTRKVHPHKGEELPHFKIDGTAHEQTGRKMEGVGWMKTSREKFVFGYSSLTIFDELGFCFAGELLPAAHPKGHPVELLDQVLSPLRGKKIKNPFEKVAHVSGDSAFLIEDFVLACQAHQASFTIAAPKTINWHTQIDEDSKTWVEWEYGPEELKKLKRKKQEPAECYVNRWHWRPSWSDKKLMFPVVIKKQWREDEVFGVACGHFHYHAVATNYDLSQRSYQSVIERYRPRADVENMIKEFKIGFDAKHLPCLKMSANEVYFLFVLIAQNLIRWAALLEQPDKPHFAKKLRRKLLTAPAQVLTGSRQLTLKVKAKFLREVSAFLEAWRSQPVIVPLYCSTA